MVSTNPIRRKPLTSILYLMAGLEIALVQQARHRPEVGGAFRYQATA